MATSVPFDSCRLQNFIRVSGETLGSWRPFVDARPATTTPNYLNLLTRRSYYAPFHRNTGPSIASFLQSWIYVYNNDVARFINKAVNNRFIIKRKSTRDKTDTSRESSRIFIGITRAIREFEQCEINSWYNDKLSFASLINSINKFQRGVHCSV